MDVLFVDVGFGTCNLILTGSGEAIVVDAGERSKEPLAALHHFHVNRIRHLIVSHWHDDHVGGATGILQAFPGRVGTVWFPPGENFGETNFWTAVDTENASGRLGDHQIRPLVIEGRGVRTIWESDSQDADLNLVSPSFIESGRGVAAGDANATSGVLVLRVGRSRIVFAGDATLTQWQRLHQRVAVPIDAEVVAVPHHAGIIWPSGWTAARISLALQNLYAHVIRPKVAVISAGTRPGEHHPRPEVVAALRAAGASVMCTQMTRRCTADLEAARLAQATALPVLVPGGRSSATPTATLAGNTNHVACAGTVFVELLDSGATVHQLAQHQAFVGTLPNPAGQAAICRR